MIQNWPKISMRHPSNHLRSIWYHSEPSDVPYFPNLFLDWDFFACSYSKTALVTVADYFDFEVFVDNLHFFLISWKVLCFDDFFFNLLVSGKQMRSKKRFCLRKRILYHQTLEVWRWPRLPRRHRWNGKKLCTLEIVFC